MDVYSLGRWSAAVEVGADLVGDVAAVERGDVEAREAGEFVVGDPERPRTGSQTARALGHQHDSHKRQNGHQDLLAIATYPVV